jgi:hypothetical protein
MDIARTRLVATAREVGNILVGRKRESGEASFNLITFQNMLFSVFGIGKVFSGGSHSKIAFTTANMAHPGDFQSPNLD